MSTIAWIDLRDNNDKAKLKLASVQGGDGRTRHYLFITGLANTSYRWTKAIENLGFVASPRGKYLSRVVRDGEQLKASMFHSVWPNAMRAQLPVDDVRLDLSASKQARQLRMSQETSGPTQEERDVAVETGVVTRLGRNAQGHDVFSTASGARYFMRDDGALVYESDILGPESFLRAPNANALDLCAEGLVQAMLHGEAQHSDDLHRFIDATTGQAGPYDRAIYDHFAVVIDAAMLRVLSRSYDTAQDAYGDANRMYDMLPPYRGVERGAGAMPLPVSVMAQRLLGDTSGKRVVVPNAWDGASFAFMAPGTQIAAFTSGKDLSERVKDVRVNDVVWSDRYEPAREHGAHGMFFNADPALDATSRRIDYRQAWNAIRSLVPDARAVLVVAADAEPGHIGSESAQFFETITRTYDVDALVEIPPTLCRQTGSGAGLRIVSLRRRAPGEASLKPNALKVAFSWDELKTYVDEAISTINLREAEGDGIDVERVASENDFQRPYIAFSKVGEAVTMVPKNMQGPLQEAMTNLERLHGPVDQFVEAELGFGQNTLGERFSPEQVDAVGLGVARLKQGKGIIIGDETGIGKGRIISALATWGAKQGKNIIFVTDRANLFSDLVRDLRDIGEFGRFRPMIMNTGASLVDVFTNETLLEGPKSAEMNRIIDQGLTLEEINCNIVFTTYSQIAGEESKKADWLLERAAGALVIVDEAHVAAGSNSNTSSVVVDLLARASGVIYSSATWAKSSENLHIYQKAFPDSINIATLSRTMKTGGEAFSEVFSSMLARDGAFIRREHDLSKIEFVVETDVPRLARNSDLSDRVAEILASMTYVSGEVSRLLSKLNNDTITVLRAARQAREAAGASGAGQGGKIFKSHFGAGSVLYQVMRRFLAVLNSDNVVDLAMKAVTENRKPVIVFEDTGEVFLRRLIQEEIIPGLDGEKDTLPDSVRPPNIKDFLRHVMKRLGVITIQPITEEAAASDGPGARSHQDRVDDNDDGDEVVDIDQVVLAQDALRQSGSFLGVMDLPGLTFDQQKDYKDGIERILKMIDALPPMPLNAVDVMRARFMHAGLQCGELSGRTYLQIAPPEQAMAGIADAGWENFSWKLERRSRKKTDVNRTVWQFNNGELDVIFINRSAATGTSLHSSPRFADSRRRELIELQIPENPTDRIQLYGRVNRYDQVTPPRISIATTGILGEVRQIMMQNKKLARLSANVRSSRENAAEIKMVPDLLNVIGEAVAKQYLEDNGGVRSRIGVTTAELETARGTALIQKLTSRVAMLRVVEQQQVYDELYEMYDDALARHEIEGTNPLKSKEFDIRATVTEHQIVIGIDMQGMGSSFDGPVYLKQLVWEEDYHPIDWPKLRQMIDMGREDLLQKGLAKYVPPPDQSDLRRQELLLANILVNADPSQRAASRSLRNDVLLGQGIRYGADVEELNLASLTALQATQQAARTDKGVLSETPGTEQAPGGISISALATKLVQILDAKSRIELVGTPFATLNEAMASEGKNSIKAAFYKKLWAEKYVPKLIPGCLVRMKEGRGEQANWSSGVVTALRPPGSGKEAQLSRWKLDVVFPYQEKASVVSLSTLMEGAGLSAFTLLGGAHEEVTSDHVIEGDVFQVDAQVQRMQRLFGSESRGPSRRIGKMEVLDGNLYQASDWAATTKMGQGILYTDERGVRHRAIKINGQRGSSMLHSMPVRLWSAPMIYQFLCALERGGVLSERDRNGLVFPTNFKGALPFADEKGTQLGFAPNERLVLNVDAKDVARVARALRADQKARMKRSHPDYDRYTSSEKSVADSQMLKVTTSAKRGKPALVTVELTRQEHLIQAVDLIVRVCGVELFLPVNSPNFELAKQAQAQHFEALRDEWAARFGVLPQSPAPVGTAATEKIKLEASELLRPRMTG